LDNGDSLYALAAFYDYPNIHGVASNDWEETWWKNTYVKKDETSKINAINTLFLHFFVAHPDYSEGCAEELINVTFKALPEINQILLCVPHQITPGWFECIFSQSISFSFSDCCRKCFRKIFQTNRK
jgi:hypothetical protein